MPSVDLARPGAERRARAAATAKLRTALGGPPARRRAQARPRSDRSRAQPGPRTTDVQYQSNGGAVIRMEVGFADWLEDPGRADHGADRSRSPPGRVAEGGGRRPGDLARRGDLPRRVAPPADAGARAARVDHCGPTGDRRRGRSGRKARPRRRSDLRSEGAAVRTPCHLSSSARSAWRSRLRPQPRRRRRRPPSAASAWSCRAGGRSEPSIRTRASRPGRRRWWAETPPARGSGRSRTPSGRRSTWPSTTSSSIHRRARRRARRIRAHRGQGAQLHRALPDAGGGGGERRLHDRACRSRSTRSAHPEQDRARGRAAGAVSAASRDRARDGRACRRQDARRPSSRAWSRRAVVGWPARAGVADPAQASSSSRHRHGDRRDDRRGGAARHRSRLGGLPRDRRGSPAFSLPDRAAAAARLRRRRGRGPHRLPRPSGRRSWPSEMARGARRRRVRPSADLPVLTIDADVVEPAAVSALLKSVRSVGAVSAADLVRVGGGHAEIRARTRSGSAPLAAALSRDADAMISLSDVQASGAVIKSARPSARAGERRRPGAIHDADSAARLRSLRSAGPRRAPSGGHGRSAGCAHTLNAGARSASASSATSPTPPSGSTISWPGSTKEWKSEGHQIRAGFHRIRDSGTPATTRSSRRSTCRPAAGPSSTPSSASSSTPRLLLSFALSARELGVGAPAGDALDRWRRFWGASVQGFDPEIVEDPPSHP